MGEGNTPVEGQEVTFDYTAYNESAGLIDSTYRKGSAASSQLGINGLIPGAQSDVHDRHVANACLQMHRIMPVSLAGMGHECLAWQPHSSLGPVT